MALRKGKERIPRIENFAPDEKGRKPVPVSSDALPSQPYTEKERQEWLAKFGGVPGVAMGPRPLPRAQTEEQIRALVEKHYRAMPDKWHAQLRKAGVTIQQVLYIIARELGADKALASDIAGWQRKKFMFPKDKFYIPKGKVKIKRKAIRRVEHKKDSETESQDGTQTEERNGIAQTEDYIEVDYGEEFTEVVGRYTETETHYIFYVPDRAKTGKAEAIRSVIGKYLVPEKRSPEWLRREIETLYQLAVEERKLETAVRLLERMQKLEPPDLPVEEVLRVRGRRKREKDVEVVEDEGEMI